MTSPEVAARHEFTPMEREIVRSWHGPLVCGDPTEVAAKLQDLVDRYRVDELMLTTMVYGQADRLRSYELVAEAWGLERARRCVRAATTVCPTGSRRPARRWPTSASK